MSGDRSDYVEDRLEELRAAMAGEECPPSVRSVVMAAFRESVRPAPVFSRWVRWGAVAACAASACVALYWMSVRMSPIVPPPVVAKAPAPPASGSVREPPRDGVVPEQLASSTARKKARVARRVRPVQPPAEVATDFIQLPFAPPMDPGEGGQVIRVTLPRSAMRTVGLPVPENGWYERVPADVVLGQDGVARAVRFVKFER